MQPHDASPFEGTAPYYSRARPPYARRLVPALVERLGLDGTGRLLDAGCGPGTLALALAGAFAEVVGLDPDPGMLAEAERQAAERPPPRPRWVRGRAEDVAALGLRDLRLTVFGQSFHWTDRAAVADALYARTRPGGALAVVNHDIGARPAPPGPGLPRIPHEEVDALLADYLGPGRRTAKALHDPGPAPHSDVLAASRFGAPERIVLPGREDLVRTPDDVLAYLYSTSFAASRLFGRQRARFEDDLRALLRVHAPRGLLWEWPGDTELLLCVR